MNIKNTIQTVIIARDNSHLSELISESMREHGNECDLNHIDTSHVTDMQFLFHESKFNGDISQWDTSQVEKMNSMFQHSSFNGDISSWNVSNVKFMIQLFSSSKFNGDISNWNVSNVEHASLMFYNCPFNGDLSRWNVSNIKNMDYMFAGTKFERSKFTGNLNDWTPYKLHERPHEMSSMFMYADIEPPYWCNYQTRDARNTAIDDYVSKKQLGEKLNSSLDTQLTYELTKFKL